MTSHEQTSALCLALIFGMGIAGCNKQKQQLTGGGSPFVFPIMSKWTAEYAKTTAIEVSYQSIGSGAGLQRMKERTIDFGCIDAPMNDEQLAKARAIHGDVVHIPLVMGAVVPVYNVPGIEKPLNFSGQVLADIFLGKIKNWNDPAIKKLNPDETMADLDITVVHRGDDSGTNFIWTEYLAKVSPEWKKKVGVGASVKWPTGLGSKGGDGIMGPIRRSAGSIGYVELISALQNKIKFGAVQNREGEFVLASLRTTTAAAEAAVVDIPEDLRYSLTNAPGKDSYPICGTAWAIAFINQPEAKGMQVREFLHWCTHQGQEFAEALHYARLPKGLVERVEKRLELIK